MSKEKESDQMFDLAELKLLVDAIQSSRFISERKSNDLIKKLTSMASKDDAAQLKRQVVVQGRVKTMNESIYYLVDDIQRAISLNHQISFEYMQWNLKIQLEKKRDEPYRVSPWALIWSEDNYYLVTFDDKDERIKHFRVDKMKSIVILYERRNGREKFRENDLVSYTNMNFGMFGGEEKDVRIEFKNEMVCVLIDRFGKDIPINSIDRDGWSETIVKVALSRHFFGWVFSLGSGVTITGPGDVTDMFVREINERKKIMKKKKSILDEL